MADKVVALCPAGGHLRIDARHRLLSRLPTRTGRLPFFHPGLVRLNVAWGFGEPLFGPNSPSCREVQERVLRQWDGPERPLLERAFIRAGRGILAQPVWPLLPEITAPLMITSGQGDHIIPPSQTERLRLYAPQGTRHAMVRGGHMPHYLAAWELAQTVRRFLG
jgi:pimeloyl-ACP methyl ester carboxylesterase